jgi:hypothetical protein
VKGNENEEEIIKDKGWEMMMMRFIAIESF